MKEYGQYFVTEDGKVYNKFGKRLRHQITYSGYCVVGLRIGGESKGKTVHRLVAELYIPNPLGKTDVDHIDGNRENNHRSNLRWLNHGENIKHSYDTGRRSAKGENNSRAILTEQEVHDICYLLQIGVACSNIRDMGYPYHCVRSIKLRKNWRYISIAYLP